ncbi:Outer membrane scaffolding protein for murein synthesis, MipA/OmpV family [Beijerinckia sp. 28-YEA-48]|nr:MipA/OmpV family protein [Beijerinckia sp. 28-YEA-48]SED14353.1 Outer membrane scaffolding protein for murein synthesis, MipA/OmpV family [Beijerinckia sp. 28-YEA-48]
MRLRLPIAVFAASAVVLPAFLINTVEAAPRQERHQERHRHLHKTTKKRPHPTVRRHHHAAPRPVYRPAPRYVAAPMPMSAPLSAPMPEPAAPSFFSPYGWLITVNAKTFVSPRFTGSDNYSFIAFPTVSFRRPGEAPEWSSPDDNISFAAFSSGGVSAGPVVAYRGGRYDQGNRELWGVHNVRWTLEPGLFGQIWLVPDTLRARLEIRRGFRGEDGFVALLGADWVTRWQQFTFAIGPRFNFADGRSMRSRFGVTATDFLANPVYAPHAPGRGWFRPVSIRRSPIAIRRTGRSPCTVATTG